MKRTTNRPFFARFLAQQELDTASGGCGGSSYEPPKPQPAPEPELPIFTTLKAGKCGNDCDSDVDILPAA